MAKKRKANSISGPQLRAAIEKAVKLEKAKDIQLLPPIHARPGIIFGMQVKGNIALEDASALAESITKRVSGPGLPKLTPAVFALKKQITVGFLDPTQIQGVLEI